MNLLKRPFIAIIGILGIMQSYGQNITIPDLNKSLIPPSPEAASLGKYGIIPVTLYEGMPNTSVPVYEIKSSKLSLPISLGYNYNGYRPGEEASWVGLGWSLQAYGVITKVIKGLVDDHFSVPYHWKDYANILDLADNQDILLRAGSRILDTEPDLYIFNFNGHSGKFILVGDRAFTFPHQDLKITPYGTGFQIIDESGITYNFQTREITTPNNSTTPGNYVPEYTSAWNLTSMVSADHTDQINFQYTTWTHRQYNNSYSETYVQQVGGKLGNTYCPGGNGSCDTWSSTNYPGALIQTKRLTSITSKNSKVIFIPENTERLDLSGGAGAFALKEIKVYSLPDITNPADTLLIRKMELAHDYFAYNAQLKLSSINLTGYYGNNTTNNPNISIPGYYKFEYANEITGSFPKLTRDIDMYGYYNGKNNPTGSTGMLFDASFLGYPPTMPASDRSVDSTKSMNGILTKIIYPTGGFTIFDYEENQLKVPNQSSYYLHLQSSCNAVYNGANNPTIAINFFTLFEEQDIKVYYSRDISNSVQVPPYEHNRLSIFKIYIPGNDENPPVPPQLIDSAQLLHPALSEDSMTIHLVPGTYLYKISCEANAFSARATIKYTKLITPPQGVSIPGPGLRIKTISSYDSVHFTTPAIVKSYTYAHAIPLSVDGYGFSTTHHFQQPICLSYVGYDQNFYTSSYSSPLASLINNQFMYPVVTEVNHDTAGSGKTVYEYMGDGFSALGVNLIRQSDYLFNSTTNKFILLKRRVNNYTEKPGVNFYGFTYNHSYQSDEPPPNCAQLPINKLDGSLIRMFDTVVRYHLYHATPYAFVSDSYQLSATEDTSYDQNGLHPMIVHTDYYYDNDNYNQPSRTVVKNSKGEIITTQIKYPFDCGATSTCNFPAFQENAFKAKREESSETYQTCTIQRYNHALPLWNPTIPNTQNAPFMAQLRAYKCETNYPSQYAAALASIVNIPCPGQSGYSDLGVFMMRANHVLNTPVEQIVSINRNGTEYLFAASRTEFDVNGGYAVYPKILDETKFTSTSTLKSDFLTNPSYYYEPRVGFKYDLYENVISEQSKTNDVKMSYIWDYKKMYAIAQCVNADKDNIAYTSFEADGKGNFNFTGTITTPPGGAVTGKRAYSLTTGNGITESTLDNTKIYSVSLWASANNVTVNGTGPVRTGRTINGWTYYEYQFSNSSLATIQGNTTIDELRLYPRAALMTTYTYDPLIGLTGQCDPNNHITYYQYDALGRLLLVRDEDKNIIKQYAYNLDNAQANTDPYWQPTGNTRCKPCPQNNNFNSNILQREERDNNPQSATYNQLRWTDLGPNAICDANASWQNTATALRCRVNDQNENTGEQEQEQQDMNPCSTTYLQLRWIVVGVNTTICPPPSNCPNCTDEGYKCIKSDCELGKKIYTSSVYHPKTGIWTCTYHYIWSDASISQDYTEESSSSCMHGDGFEGEEPAEGGGG